jgi:hypothetical protein
MSRLPRQSGVHVGAAPPQALPPSQAAGNRLQQRVSPAVTADQGTRRHIAADAYRPRTHAAPPRSDAPTGMGIEWTRAVSEIAEANAVGRAGFAPLQRRAGRSFPSDQTRPQGLSGEIFSFLAPAVRDSGVLRADRQQAALEALEKSLAGLDGSVAHEAARVIRGALRTLVQLREVQNSLIRG